MVITSPIHPGMRPTASPPKTLRPVLEKFLLITTVIILKYQAKYIRMLCITGPPTCSIAGARPSDEFEGAFVESVIFAFTILVIPYGGLRLPTQRLVGSPIGHLARFTWIRTCWLTGLRVKRKGFNRSSYVVGSESNAIS
jgi:hypothetical protein